MREAEVEGGGGGGKGAPAAAFTPSFEHADPAAAGAGGDVIALGVEQVADGRGQDIDGTFSAVVVAAGREGRQDLIRVSTDALQTRGCNDAALRQGCTHRRLAREERRHSMRKQPDELRRCATRN